MKEFFRSFFASLLAIVVSGVLFVVFIVFLVVGAIRSVTDNEKEPVKGDVLLIDLTKKIHEQGETDQFASFSDGPAYKAGLYDITYALQEAGTDNSIKGVYLRLGPSANGWAALQELRNALKDFKRSGKFVYGYGENITQGAYFVASVCDSVFLNPSGSIDLKGMSTSLAFFKGTLDKLELQPEIYYAGKFKSATEPFRADRMSEPNKLQIRTFQDGMWDQFLLAAAEHMRTGKDTIHQLAVAGAIQFPQDAEKYGMVDGLRYRDQVERLIRKETGKSEKDDIEFIPINDYSGQVRETGTHGTKPVIGILCAEGDIVDGEQNNTWEIASVTMCNEIRKLRLNDNVKAVVLRVNSPGGSALASEVILRELSLLKAKKPLIVSMGNYAASGGYYIATAADSIFALPNTITGSIGVFGMLFNIDKMMNNKLGVTFDGVKNAPYADFPTATRPLTAEEGQRMQRTIDTIYAQFKGHVAAGRKLSGEMVDSIAQGRVWTGTDALRLGLVDRLGGLDMALESAAALAKLGNYKVVTFPEPQDKLSSLMKRLGSNTETKTAIREALKEEAAPVYEWYSRLKSLQRMNGRAMMALPYTIDIGE
ncbi:signal peptide peptidase SppA [Nemorincola caseinilytica]|uniref:Signal peptide peptidase SppA n=1 Tax=Nemorincola caseinilytica TaxID=2054315 RepID=A0ABP8NCT1_9BACT